MQPGAQTLRLKARDASGELVDEAILPLIIGAGLPTVGGTLTEDTAWGPERPLLRVTEDLEVERGATLTLTGVTLLFDPGVNLVIRGGLQAQHATLTSAQPGERWGQVRLLEPDSPIRIADTDIAWGTVHAVGAEVTMERSSVRFANSLRLWNIDHTVFADDTALIARECAFTDNEAPILVHRPRALIFEDCHFVNIRGDHDAIDVDAASERALAPRQGDYRIIRCTIDGVGDDGIDWFGLDFLIEDCVIRDIVDKGISVEHECASMVRRTRIEEAESGVVSKIGALITFEDCSFADCDNAVEARDTAQVILRGCEVDGEEVGSERRVTNTEPLS